MLGAASSSWLLPVTEQMWLFNDPPFLRVPKHKTVPLKPG